MKDIMLEYYILYKISTLLHLYNTNYVFSSSTCPGRDINITPFVMLIATIMSQLQNEKL